MGVKEQISYCYDRKWISSTLAYFPDRKEENKFVIIPDGEKFPEWASGDNLSPDPKHTNTQQQTASTEQQVAGAGAASVKC